jgi:hypothetical protein
MMMMMMIMKMIYDFQDEPSVLYSTAQRENAKSASFQGLSQRGINEKSVYTWTVRETTWTWKMIYDFQDELFNFEQILRIS